MNTLTTAQRTQEQDQLSAELVSLALKNPRSIAFHVLYQFHPEFSLWIHNFPCCAALPSPGGEGWVRAFSNELATNHSPLTK